MWLEYSAALKYWQVKSTANNKGTNLCYAIYVVPSKCLPEECSAGGLWYVYDGDGDNKRGLQPAFVISVVSNDVCGQ